MTDPTKRKMKIFQDEIKLKHTSHWDTDTMSRAEFEAYMRGELELASANVHQAAAAQCVPDMADAPASAAPCRAGRNESLWARFMRACTPGA